MLAKTELNAIEVLIPKALTDSNVSHDESASKDKAQNEYNEIKE